MNFFKEVGVKITEVACGGHHAICKTTNGRVYTWGLGNEGQLGIGSRKSAMYPNLVKMGSSSSRNFKAISIQAGLSSSYVLLESRKVFHAGTNSVKNKEDLYFNVF